MSVPEMLEKLRKQFGEKQPSIYECLKFGMELENAGIVENLRKTAAETKNKITRSYLEAVADSIERKEK